MILSLQGSMAAGKTTAAGWIADHAPHIHVCPEDPGDVIAQVKRLGLDKSKFGDYVQIQRLWLHNEIRRWEEAQRYPLSLMDFGAEEIEFYTLHYPRSMGYDWDVACALAPELTQIRRCMPQRILFLDAPEAELRRRKEADPTRSRNFFEHYVTHLLPLKRAWFFPRENVDVLDVSALSPKETGAAVLRWAEAQFNRQGGDHHA